MGPTSPVFVGHFERGDVEIGSEHRLRAFAGGGRRKEHANRVLALFDRRRGQVVDRREQAVRICAANLERGVGLQLTRLRNYSITRFPNPLSEHVLDAIEQVALVLLIFARAWLEFFGRQDPGELIEQVPLLARKFPGRQHLDGREQVATSAA